MEEGNVTQKLAPPASGAIERFDKRRATEFAKRSTSEKTRRYSAGPIRSFSSMPTGVSPRLRAAGLKVASWRVPHILRSISSATVFAVGTISCRSSTALPRTDGSSSLLNPVRLPPGRAKLSTTPH